MYLTWAKRMWYTMNALRAKEVTRRPVGEFSPNEKEHKANLLSSRGTGSNYAIVILYVKVSGCHNGNIDKEGLLRIMKRETAHGECVL